MRCEGDAKKARSMRRGARGCKKGAGDAAGCSGDAGVLWQNVMYRGGLQRKTFDFCASIVHTAGFSSRICRQVGTERVHKTVRNESQCVEGRLALFAVVSARASGFANGGCFSRR